MDEAKEAGAVIARELLGSKVRDTVTGLRGTVTGVAEYLNGVSSAGVEYLDAQGVARTEWIAQQRLKTVEA